MTEIKEHMEVIGADGVHVGTVDQVEGGRIKLTKKDSGEGSHKGHHHFIDKSLVAGGRRQQGQALGERRCGSDDGRRKMTFDQGADKQQISRRVVDLVHRHQKPMHLL